MLGFRQDLAPSYNFNAQNSAAQLPAPSEMQEKQEAGEVETLRAIEALSDTTKVSQQAQTQAELQALMDKLSNATVAQDVKSALLAVKDFVNDTSNASMMGDAIGGLSDMADSVLQAMDADPSSFSGGVSFAFSGTFSSQTMSSEEFYSNKTSMSFSFSFSSAETTLSGSMNFSESLELSEEGLRYESYERVSLSMVTMNANLETNPVLQAFADITTRLSGIDMAALFGEMQEAEEPSALLYRSVTSVERTEMQFGRLEDAVSANQSLIDWLEEWREGMVEASEEATQALAG